ncbi:MAG: hypothetical protein J0M00_18600 [Burkholderiales bacterium]|nr:hypothetical protein [Burkholderiales bacterium]
MPVTDEQLRLAFRQISRPGWPATLEAALEQPVYRTALLGIARNLNRGGIEGRRSTPASPAARSAHSREEAIALVRHLITRHGLTEADLLPPLPLFTQGNP